MYKASLKKMLSKNDQEHLQKKIENWRQENPQDFFFFRPCALAASSTDAEGNNDETDENCARTDLLFAHQTTWQKKLMIRYGNEITLLDATYKTMRYELPVYFFLMVKTNVNYIVVGSFIIQRETTASIQEALGIFHAWNGSWKPQYFTTDFCHEEMPCH